MSSPRQENQESHLEVADTQNQTERVRSSLFLEDIYGYVTQMKKEIKKIY